MSNPRDGSSSSSQDAGPLVSLEYCDAPTQRFYATALFVLLQSYKLFAFIESYVTSSASSRSWLLLKYSFYDVLVLAFILPRLRIPRFVWPARVTALLVGTVLLANWIIVGDWHARSLLGVFSIVLPTSLRDYFSFDLAILEHRIRYSSLLDPAAHILGSHTIHILPHSTARFPAGLLDSTAQASTYLSCVSVQESGPFTPTRYATIPVLFNNTSPKWLQYSITPFGSTERNLYNLSSDDFEKVAVSKHNKRSSKYTAYEEDMEEWEAEDRAHLAQQEEYDFATASGTVGQKLLGYDGDYDSDMAVGFSNGKKSKKGKPAAASWEIQALLRNMELQASQSVYSFQVRTPGVLRIERVIDKANNDVRIPASSSNGLTIVPCPSAEFTESKSIEQTTCQSTSATAGDTGNDVDIGVQVFGYPPLRLSYHRMQGNGQNSKDRQAFHVDGIAQDGAILSPHPNGGANSKKRVASNSQQPLQITYGGQAAGNTAVPDAMTLRLNVTRNIAGLQVFRLDKVTDAFGHVQDISALRDQYPLVAASAIGKPASSPGQAKRSILGKKDSSASSTQARLLKISERKVRVFPRSSVNFYGCGGASGTSLGESVKLLKGKRTKLQMRVTSSLTSASSKSQAEDDAPWSAKVAFLPEDDSASQGWEKEVALRQKQEFLEVDAPGRYILTSLDGRHCPGDVLEPSECNVYTPPLPTVDLSLDPITDACAGEVGLRAIFSLTGEAPYKISYSVTHGSGRPTEYTKTIRSGSRDELELRPEQTGEFTYEFISLQDKNYDSIPIGKTVKQVVHPLAGVKFVNPGKERSFWSCDGEAAADKTIKVPIELKGTAPWTLEYRILGNKQPFTVAEITQAKLNLDVPIPSKVLKNGGSFTVSIVSVKDGRGCSQPMTVEDLVVNVVKSSPTAAFANTNRNQDITVKQGEQVQLPLRLTGEGPWKVTYQHSTDKPRTVTIKAANGQLLVDQAGAYTLLSVSDAHCPGTVTSTRSSHTISWIERPTVGLAKNLGKIAKNGSVIRPPVCEGVPDTAGFVFSGQAPFTVAYELVEDSTASEGSTSKRTKLDLQTVQKHAQFELVTSTAGHRTYELTGVSDSVYTTLSKEGILASSEGGKKHIARLEQDVLARPSAHFVAQDRAPIYCVKESLNERDHSLEMRFSGVPPFRAEFEVAPEGSHMSQRYSDVHIPRKTWHLSLPHTLAEPGPFSIFLRRLVDATGCERTYARGTKGTFARLEVVEIASISPVQVQKDHCVGESIDFVLQGASPWTVNYEFNGKKQSVSSKESRFSRVAESPGDFSVKSVAHYRDSCKSIVTDIQKTIHPLPAAKVHSGTTFIENIREGDQAEIVFEFEGTPPFTFTYTKSLPASSKSRKPTIQETHTITGVATNRYSIYTQSEGTWAVTSISDAHCSYPPLDRADRKLLTPS